MAKKNYTRWILLFLFLLSLTIRLLFAFQTPYLDHDSYFELRQVEHIKEYGYPAFHDELSYGERTYYFSPFFHYFITFLSLAFPLEIIVKIIPNVLMAALVFLVYDLSFILTKDKAASLIASAMSIFLPMLFANTFNALTPYTLILFLSLMITHYFIRLRFTTDRREILLVVTILIVFTHSSSLLLALGLVFYMILSKIMKKRIPTAQAEYTLFFFFLSVWANFIIFKKSFLIHQTRIFWQNIPMALLDNYFTDITVVAIVYAIGLIPVLLGIYAMYRMSIKEKNPDALSIVSILIVFGVVALLKLIPLQIGIFFLSIYLVTIASQSFVLYFKTVKNSRLEFLKPVIVLVVGLIFVFTSILPTIAYAHNTIAEAPTEDQVTTFQWIEKNTLPEHTIAAPLVYGHLITSFSRRQNVIDNIFLNVLDAAERYKDINNLYMVKFETHALQLSQKYSIDYIYLDNTIKEEYDIDSLFYIDSYCFNDVFNTSTTQLYAVICG